MATFKFYIRNSQVQCSVCWPGNRLQLSTGEHCITANWSTAGAHIKRSTAGAADSNIVINNIKSALNDYLLECRLYSKVIDKDKIRKIITGRERRSDGLKQLFDLFIEESSGGIRTTGQGKRIKEDTIRQYSMALKNLTEFLEHANIPKDIGSLTPTTGKSWQAWMWSEKDLYDNYVGNLSKMVNCFMAWSHDRGFIPEKPKSWKVWKEEKDIMVLYPAELRELATMPCSDHLIDDTRNIFLIGCITCLRISDLFSLRKSKNIITFGDSWSLALIAGKTSLSQRIPLPDFAVNIFKKYDLGDRLLPEISYQEFNLRLKQMAQAFRLHLNGRKLAGNDWDAHFIITRYKGGRPIREAVNIEQVFTSHTMRRTGISNLLMAGVPEIAVKAISGHTLNSKDFAKYVKIAHEFIESRTNAAWDHVFEKEQK